jgi:hypothetical protein
VDCIVVLALTIWFTRVVMVAGANVENVRVQVITRDVTFTNAALNREVMKLAAGVRNFPVQYL